MYKVCVSWKQSLLYINCVLACFSLLKRRNNAWQRVTGERERKKKGVQSTEHRKWIMGTDAASFWEATTRNDQLCGNWWRWSHQESGKISVYGPEGSSEILLGWRCIIPPKRWIPQICFFSRRKNIMGFDGRRLQRRGLMYVDGWQDGGKSCGRNGLQVVMELSRRPWLGVIYRPMSHTNNTGNGQLLESGYLHSGRQEWNRIARLHCVGWISQLGVRRREVHYEALYRPKVQLQWHRSQRDEWTTIHCSNGLHLHHYVEITQFWRRVQ